MFPFRQDLDNLVIPPAEQAQTGLVDGSEYLVSDLIL